MNNTFRIVHISDMHIGDHSDEAWRALTKAIKNIQPDLVVISGDLSNSNASSDMESVCTWIKGEVSSRASKPSFGLNCGSNYRDKVVVVPGNHDYFFNNVRRLQRSKYSDVNDLQFNCVFDVESYPNWRFIDRNDSPGVYIVCIDTAKELSIANGIVEKNVLEKIRKWSDKARQGELQKNTKFLGVDGLSKDESVNKYREAYKILVLHNYVVAPVSVGSQPLMTIDNSYELLGQIAADNFDIILSGHDHLGYVDSCSYASVLEPRAMTRFARMHCIRRLGIKKPRVYMVNENNQLLPKSMRLALDIWERFEDLFGKIYRHEGITPIKKYIRRGYSEFIKYDLRNRELKAKLEKLAKLIEDQMEDILNDRNIVNAIGYSATADGEQTKGFFVFDLIDNSKRTSNIESTRWIYDSEKDEFVHKFPRTLPITQPLDSVETDLFNLMHNMRKAEVTNA